MRATTSAPAVSTSSANSSSCWSSSSSLTPGKRTPTSTIFSRNVRSIRVSGCTSSREPLHVRDELHWSTQGRRRPSRVHAQRAAGVLDDDVDCRQVPRRRDNRGDGARTRPARLRPAHPALDHANAAGDPLRAPSRTPRSPRPLGRRAFRPALRGWGRPSASSQHHDVRIAHVGDAPALRPARRRTSPHPSRRCRRPRCSCHLETDRAQPATVSTVELVPSRARRRDERRAAQTAHPVARHLGERAVGVEEGHRDRSRDGRPRARRRPRRSCARQTARARRRPELRGVPALHVDEEVISRAVPLLK